MKLEGTKKIVFWSVVWFMAAVAYINIGLIIAYSFDSGADQTAITNSVDRSIDWFALTTRRDGDSHNLILIFLWPIFVIVIWAANALYAIFLLGKALFAGGLLRWLGVFKF